MTPTPSKARDPYLWQQFRVLLLALTFIGVCAAITRSLLGPQASEQTVYNFPETIPLPGWQSLNSTPIKILETQKPHFVAGRRYHYLQKQVHLEIEMRYLSRSSGDVQRWLKSYTSLPANPDEPLPIQHQHSAIGSYGLFTYQGRAYLSACINSRGGSTLTAEQFAYNRNTYDLQPHRLLPWLMGWEELRDWRCLWAHLSIPVQQTSTEQAYQALETAWFSWYQGWLPRFPKY